MRTRVTMVLMALPALLATAGLALGQTQEIQKKVEQKLDKAKKDQAALEDLLALALKTNGDIRVAESKLREAEAELYRARIKVVNRIVLLQQELKNSRRQVSDYQAAYDHSIDLLKKGLDSKVIVDDFAAKLQLAKLDVTRAEAEMDLLCGKTHKDLAGGATARAIEWLARTQIAEGTHIGEGFRIWDLSADTIQKPGQVAPGAPAPVQASMAEKIRKALDTSIKPPATGGEILGREFLDFLREYAKGINIQAGTVDTETAARFQLKEAIPLGALFEWAEDQFEWRFIVRDYGIVATDRKNVPPGATLLMDFWRKGPDVGKGSAAPK